MTTFRKMLLSAVCVVALSPTSAFACACGCGVFDVSTGTMLPTSEGGKAWLEYDFSTQNQNRSGLHQAPRDDNADHLIHTDFITAGVEYMFNRSWGAEVELPYWNRNFKTQTDTPNTGDTQIFNTSSFGDVRLKAVYTGFSEDMSTGLTLGVKLPTGDFTAANYDRDTQIGTGSTDVLIGAYHQGALAEKTSFNWFVHGEWDQPVSIQDDYRPGDEFDAAVGVYDNDFYTTKDSKLTPLLQVIGSARMRDRGANAHPEDTGYTRLLISPGVEYDINQISLYGDVEVPIYQNVNGNQITAPVMFKLMVGYKF